MVADALYSGAGRKRGGKSGKDNWLTPPSIIERLVKFGPIVLDPCSSPQSLVPAKHVLYESDDGLSVHWDSPEPNGTIFINFPYSQSALWAPIIAEEGCALRAKRDTIALCAARTSEKWFQHFWSADCFVFITGRVRFLQPSADPAQSHTVGKFTAPFPSVLPCWTRRVREIEECFGDIGHVLTRYEIPF